MRKRQMRGNDAGMVFLYFQVDLLAPNPPFMFVITGPDETLEFPIDASMLGPEAFR